MLFSFLCGLALDLYSLINLPFITYSVLSSLHIVFFKYFNSNDHELTFNKAERVGVLCIILSSAIIGLTGGSQDLEKMVSDPERLLIPYDYYFIYNFCWILMVLVTRRLGFYSGKIFLESIIPAQFTVCLLGTIKLGVFYLRGAESVEDPTNPWKIVFPLGLGLFILFTVGISFIKIFVKHHDIVVVYGAYAVWSVVLSIPVEFGFLFRGTNYTVLGIFRIVVAVFTDIIGMLFIAYQRVEYLKMAAEDKTTMPSPQPGLLEAAPLPEEPHNLELNIEDENLMDAEIIDEDLLIRTIRNI